ncbi:MAG: acyltransferase family protein, partial [Acidimicrobiales bacterium]
PNASTYHARRLRYSRATVRWVGKISYGLYLWHWPIIQIVNETNTGLSGWALRAAQVALMFGIGATSYYLIELPIRRAKFSGWRRWTLAPVGISATAAIVLVGTIPVAEASSVALPLTVATSTGARGSSALQKGVSGTKAAANDPPSNAADQGPLPAPISLISGRVISRSDPLRIDIIGDSVMDDAEPGVAAALEATDMAKVKNYSFGGWGFTTAGSWRSSLTEMIQRDHPDLFMGMTSWDSPAAESDPVGYSGLLNQALSLLLAPGTGVSGVVFFEYPKTGPLPADTNTTQRITQTHVSESGREAWNAVVNGLVPLWPGKVMFLPVASSLEVNGHFSSWLPSFGGKWVRARKIDNAHVCPLGAAELASAVSADLAPVFHLPATGSGWLTGSWTKDPKYNDPPGSCPDDQPPAGYVASLAPGAPLTSQFS